VSDPIESVPATPEGGEPYRPLYSDDAKVEILLARAEENLLSLSMTDVADLASALRSQREEVRAYERHLDESHRSLDWYADRLGETKHKLIAAIDQRIGYRRELAEVRDTRELLDIASIGAWLMEHRGWDSADVDELDEALRVVVVRAAEDKETPDG
jgi:hypothetical protein